MTKNEKLQERLNDVLLASVGIEELLESLSSLNKTKAVSDLISRIYTINKNIQRKTSEKKFIVKWGDANYMQTTLYEHGQVQNFVNKVKNAIPSIELDITELKN